MYFRVKCKGESKTRVLNLADSTKIGGYYKTVDGKPMLFKVLNKVNFKYTLDELDTLRVMLEGYTEGVYFELHKRVCKAIISGIPNIRFSNLEKDYLSYIYSNSQCATKEEKDLICKIVGIQE